ncbi:hypothetical protein Tsubulata_012377 [Turnera subulata]|uniref:Neprosin PEP catalytic domain-containing protein n=1 Tax=Turnera subulata TaxID=218843 RepID=A0A9Q0FVU8_9ROSI|nr:hypothetical protein Tsubulata_012377 [Turnera subulata]
MSRILYESIINIYLQPTVKSQLHGQQVVMGDGADIGAEGTQRGSCYNTLCPAPAFILETSEIPLDYAFPQISQRGGDIYSTGFFVYKDKANGDWYLQVGTKGVGIGRWPQKMFGALADSASYIEWGGQVITPPNVPSPEMGSGHQLPLSLDEQKYRRNKRELQLSPKLLERKI